MICKSHGVRSPGAPTAAGIPAGLLAAAFAALLALGPCLSAAAAGPAQGRLALGPESLPTILSGQWLSAPEAGAETFVDVPIRSSTFRLEVDRGPRVYSLLVDFPEQGEYALLLPDWAGVEKISLPDRTLWSRVGGPRGGDGGATGPWGSSSRVGWELRFRAERGQYLLSIRWDPSRARGRSLETPPRAMSPILLGAAAGVAELRGAAGGSAAFLVGFYLFGALFCFLLFVIWHKNREFLAFAAFLLAEGVHHVYKLSVFLPWVPAAGDLGFALSLEAVMFGLVLFYLSLEPRLPRPVAAAALGVPLVLAAAALVAELAPGPGPSWAAAPRYVALAAAVLHGALLLGVLGRASWLALRGGRRARAYLPALLPAALASVLARFAGQGWTAMALEPLGLALGVLLTLAILVRKVGEGFETAETLSDYVTNVTTTVNRFIPKEFLEFLEKRDVVDLRLGDHVKKEMTIFFSDIRAFTELSERLTIEENFAFINSYLARVVPIITERGGFVDKYIGDAIMALFPGDGGPDAAIRSAVEMQRRMVEYNGHRAKVGYRPISMGVGIHTGALMLGVVGVKDRMENTVISDAVNLASRLQAITKAFNIAVAISEQAFKELDDPGEYKYRFIGKVRVKGKAAPVSVFEIFDGIEEGLFERKMKANTFFEQGMLSYYQKDFAGAMYYFKRVLDSIPEDGASAFYLDNCMNKAAL